MLLGYQNIWMILRWVLEIIVNLYFYRDFMLKYLYSFYFEFIDYCYVRCIFKFEVWVSY